MKLTFNFSNHETFVPRQLTNLDIDLLRSFAAIARLGSFTRAAELVGRQQSTISLQIRRLEDVLGQTLLVRTPQAVKLTAAGERVLASAQRLLDLNDELVAEVREPQMAGVVRLGTPEDFATSHLPGVLERFAKAYPAVAMEVTCDLTLNLYRQFQQQAFDICLIKREQTIEAAGVKVWREPLVWVTRNPKSFEYGTTVPLVVSPEPCVYRKRAVDALRSAGFGWRIAYTCGALSGSLAAVRASLGITVLPKDMVPDDLFILEAGPLPDLENTEIALLSAAALSVPAQRLLDHIVLSLGKH